jgi:hypothetical protein
MAEAMDDFNVPTPSELAQGHMHGARAYAYGRLGDWSNAIAENKSTPENGVLVVANKDSTLQDAETVVAEFPEHTALRVVDEKDGWLRAELVSDRSKIRWILPSDVVLYIPLGQ